MAVGVAEVVWVDGYIFHLKSVQLSCNQGKRTKGMHTNILCVAGDENQSRLWNMTTKFEGRGGGAHL